MKVGSTCGTALFPTLIFRLEVETEFETEVETVSEVEPEAVRLAGQLPVGR